MNVEDKPRRDRAWLVIGLLILCLLAAESVAVHAFFSSKQPGANDYYSRWAGARALILEQRDPYSVEVTREIQAVIGVDPSFEGKGGFAYPLYTLFGFWPLIFLTYDWAQAIWFVIVQWIAIAIVAVMLRLRQWRPSPLGLATLCLGTLLLYPVARTIILGQFTLHVTLFLALTILALNTGRDVWAGLFLAASSIKPQLIILVVPGLILWAIVQRRWRFFVGLAAGGIGLVAAGMLLFPRWPISFLEDVQRYSQVAGGRNPVGVLFDTVWPDAPQTARYTLVGILIVAMLASWWRGRYDMNGGFVRALYWTLVVSVLVPFQTGTTNQVLLLIPLLGWLDTAIRRGWRGYAVATVVVLELALWLTFAATIHGDWEDPIMFLPLPLFGLGILLLSEFQLWQKRRWLLVPAQSDSRQ